MPFKTTTSPPGTGFASHVTVNNNVVFLIVSTYGKISINNLNSFSVIVAQEFYF